MATKESDPLVIVDGVRTPFAKMNTDFAGTDAVELGRSAVNAVLSRTGIDPGLIDETIFGCVAQPMDAANIARVIALRAGIPERIPAMTVHRNCASGMESITTAHARMAAGQGDVFIVGGTESMSRIPLLFSAAAAAKFGALSRARTGGARVAALCAFRPADFAPVVSLKLGLTDPVCDLNMGQTAELLARDWNINRDEQDAFALTSHERAVAAREAIDEELTPVYTGSSSKQAIVRDNGPRENQSMEALRKLRPAFDRRHGTVTAGNSSQITDGAVALLVMKASRAEALGLEPLGRLLAYRYAGCEPTRMGMGPAHAIALSYLNDGLHPDDADVIEINEAFAAQAIAVTRALASPEFASRALGLEKPLGEIPSEKLNPNGGAIALGHPVGASGARLVLTALKHLHRTGGKKALVSLCIGGGQGGALWLERI